MPHSTDYKIHISSDMDDKGVKSAISDFSDLGKEIGKDGAALDAMKAKLAQASAGSEIKKTIEEITGRGAGLVETGEKAESASEKIHGLHAIIRTVGTQFPGLERFSRFLESGFTAALGVVAIAAAFLKEKIDELAKVSLQDLGQGSDEATENVKKLGAAMDDSNTSAAAWRHEIDRVVTAEETLKDKTDEVIRRQKDFAQSQNELAAAGKELEQARIDLAEKLGQITPLQAIKLKVELDEESFQEQLKAKQAEIQATINARTKEQSDNEGRQPELNKKVEDSKAAAEAAAAAKIAHDRKLENDEANLKTAKDNADKAQATIDKLQGGGVWRGGAWDTTDHQYWELEDAKKVQAQSQAIMGTLPGQIKKDRASQADIDTAAATSKADYEKNKQEYSDAAKEAHDLGLQLKSLAGDLAAAKESAKAITAVHNAAVETRAAAQEADAKKKLQEDIQSGRATPQENQEWNDAQTQARAAHEPGGQAAVDASVATAKARIILDQISRQKGHQATADQSAELHGILDEITGYLLNHAQQLNSQRSELSGIKRTLEDVQQIQSQSGNVRG